MQTTTIGLGRAVRASVDDGRASQMIQGGAQHQQLPMGRKLGDPIVAEPAGDGPGNRPPSIASETSRISH